MKYEWKKQEKNLYLPKEKPELITIPKQNYTPDGYFKYTVYPLVYHNDQATGICYTRRS